MALISELITELKLKTAEFSKELSKAEKEAEKGGSAIGKKMAIGITAGIGIAITGFGLLLHSINENVEKIDELAHTASKFGTTVEAIQKLQYAAKLADVSTGSLNTGVNKLVMSLNSLNNGSKNTSAAFQKLGLSASDFKGLSLDQSFTKVLTEINKIPNVLERTRMGVQIFGRSFSKISELAKVDIKAAGDEFERFGGVISESGAKGVSDYQESTKKLGTILDVFITRLTVGVAPALEQITTRVTQAIEDFGGLGKVADSFGRGMISVLKGIVGGFYGFLNILDQTIIKLEQMIKLLLRASQFGTLGLSNVVAGAGDKIQGLNADIAARQQAIIDRTATSNSLSGGLQDAKNAIGGGGEKKLSIDIKASADFMLSLAGTPEFMKAVQLNTIATAAREAAMARS